MKRLSERGLTLPAHYANSASILRFGAETQPIIRPGLALYGYDPAPHLPDPRLHPVMRLVAPILQVREFSPGETQEQLNELSSRAGTIPNEFLAGLTSRVGRVWVD